MKQVFSHEKKSEPFSSWFFHMKPLTPFYLKGRLLERAPHYYTYSLYVVLESFRSEGLFTVKTINFYMGTHGSFKISGEQLSSQQIMIRVLEEINTNSPCKIWLGKKKVVKFSNDTKTYDHVEHSRNTRNNIRKI